LNQLYRKTEQLTVSAPAGYLTIQPMDDSDLQPQGLTRNFRKI
jgi:hypothetical protein